MTEDDKIRLDYERTAQYFFHLADVRFRLLALLPIVSGTALALVPSHLEPAEALALGALGLVVTIGVLFYDQRNSQKRSSRWSRAWAARWRSSTGPYGSDDFFIVADVPDGASAIATSLIVTLIGGGNWAQPNNPALSPVIMATYYVGMLLTLIWLVWTGLALLRRKA